MSITPHFSPAYLQAGLESLADVPVELFLEAQGVPIPAAIFCEGGRDARTVQLHYRVPHRDIYLTEGGRLSLVGEPLLFNEEAQGLTKDYCDRWMQSVWSGEPNSCVGRWADPKAPYDEFCSGFPLYLEHKLWFYGFWLRNIIHVRMNPFGE